MCAMRGGLLRLEKCTLKWDDTASSDTDVVGLIYATQGRAIVDRCEVEAVPKPGQALEPWKLLGLMVTGGGNLLVSRTRLQGCSAAVDSASSLVASHVDIDAQPPASSEALAMSTDSNGSSSSPGEAGSSGGSKRRRIRDYVGLRVSGGSSAQLRSCRLSGFHIAVKVRGALDCASMGGQGSGGGGWGEIM